MMDSAFAMASEDQQAKVLQSHLQLAYFNYLQMLPRLMGSENVDGNLGKKMTDDSVGPKQLNLNLNLNLGLNNLNLNLINPNTVTSTIANTNANPNASLPFAGSCRSNSGDHHLDLIANVVVNESLKKEHKKVQAGKSKSKSSGKGSVSASTKRAAETMSSQHKYRRKADYASASSSSPLETGPDPGAAQPVCEHKGSRKTMKHKLETLVKRSRSVGRPKSSSTSCGKSGGSKAKSKSLKGRAKTGAKRGRKPKKHASDPLPLGVHYATTGEGSFDLAHIKEEFPKKKRSRQQSSKYRGVSRCKKDGRFQARIRVGSSVKYLGRFKTELEAAMCYDVAAVHYHGAKAVPNFPNSTSETCT